MKYDKEKAEALLESIDHWVWNAKHPSKMKYGARDCALCTLYLGKWTSHCPECPINVDDGSSCHPIWRRVSSLAAEAAEAVQVAVQIAVAKQSTWASVKAEARVAARAAAGRAAVAAWGMVDLLATKYVELTGKSLIVDKKWEYYCTSAE